MQDAESDDMVSTPEVAGRRKGLSRMRRQIRHELEHASSKHGNIAAATKILLEAVELEDSLVKMATTIGTQSRNALAALNNLWDKKALAADIFPKSGPRHIELLKLLFDELPDRKDIQAKINELTAERDNFLNELISLLGAGDFMAVMRKSSRSKWRKYPQIIAIVAKAREGFINSSPAACHGLPDLIGGRHIYELNKFLAGHLPEDIPGLNELREEVKASIVQSKQLYDQTVELSASGKFPEAAKALEKMSIFCKDHPDAAGLLEKINYQASEYTHHLFAAKKHLAHKEYRTAKKILKPLYSKYSSEEVRKLCAEASRGYSMLLRKIACVAALALVSIITIIVFAVNRNLDHKAYRLYCEKASVAISVKEYGKAVEFLNEALKVPGYAKAATAKKMLEQARSNMYFKVPEIGMEFVWIKALDCWVGKYEVTNDEYRRFRPAHDSKSFGKNALNGGRQPVVYVNFDDATEYAKWLNTQERKAGRLPAGYRYRLPSKNEWTAFAQCGVNRKFPWGDSMPPQYGNYQGQEGVAEFSKILSYNDGFPVTCPVENSGKNEWGLYGVGGNVWECTVKSDSDLAFDAWRGASWSYSSPEYLRTTSPGVNSASNRTYGGGFRLVLAH
jgi:formylglycine-generating enzyme required for sulfatase activity